jgi:pimeloyl-ACP methyl ester carboxylesterase
MKPIDYQVGGKDSSGNTIESILAQNTKVVVYMAATTKAAPRGELWWDYDGDLPDPLRPAKQRYENLFYRVKSSRLSLEDKEVLYERLGSGWYDILSSGDLASVDTSFKPVEDGLAEVAPTGTKFWKRFRVIRWFQSSDWQARVVAGMVGLLLLSMVWAWTDAWITSGKSPKVIVRPGKTGSEELVVVVHGFKGNLKRMEGVLQTIRDERPNADVLFFTYPASTFSNTDPFILANQLEEEIARQDKARNYKRIILSGYSMGALIIRKAYVYGCGSVEDLPLAGGGHTSRAPREWCKKVDRIVLLAGMNRGWSLDFGPKDMTWGITHEIHRAGILLARFTGTAKFIRSFERGEPFVANLRLQWLSTMEKAKVGEDGLRLPVVVQLLGDKDDRVDKDDSRDVTVARDFIWVGVNNTDHAGLVRLDEEGDGLERKRRIQDAFGSEADIADLKRANPVHATDTDTNVTTVVFVLHGIRDMGEWTSEFKKPLEERFAKQHAGTTDKIFVHRATYGYFPMGSFLLLRDRQKNVRWFMDQVTELRARFPRLKEIHFIGHSNGTYVLASALEKYQTLRVGHVVFAGSVVRCNYPWEKLTGRVKRVRNYIASSDWVVGLFPRLFEISGFHLINPDLGSAGFNGFRDGFVKDWETRYAGGHSAALDPRNVESIVDFILTGNKTEVPELLAKTPPGALNFISNICWIVWLVLLVLLGWIGWKLPSWIFDAWRRFRGEPKISFSTLKWITRMTYVVTLWLLIITI